MYDPRRHTILQGAISTWGGQKQIDVAIEEMSELIKALLKKRRSENDIRRSGNEDSRLETDVREEMADVQIMLDQLRLIYGNTEKFEAEKLNRLEDRLRSSGRPPGLWMSGADAEPNILGEI